ncbi:MAG: transposase [Methylococcaceae bacterium]|nr:transposase [Methylococcaceae bacterium]
MTEYRRYRVAGGTYFFTVNLAERNRKLLTEHVDVLKAAVRTVMKAHPFEIDAMVILPDHLHAIWTLPENDDDFSLRWRQIKSEFSRVMEKDERISKSRTQKQERGIWQRRFWEHAIRDEKDFERHADYIHYNPVKHGYVHRALNWQHSSFHRYVRLGILPSNWAGVGVDDLELEWHGRSG